MTTPQNIGYCTAQCWYDNVVYTPAGAPDVVYLGGSFSYGQLHAQSNGRAWLLSTDGGATWSDLTQDGDPNHAEGSTPTSTRIVTRRRQAAAVHHRSRRRRRPLGRQVRRRLGQMRQRAA